MPLVIKKLTFRESFKRDFARAPKDVRQAAEAALEKMLANASAGALRLHPLRGYPKPTIFKIDVLSNHSWQITFELEDGDTAVLLRLGTHSQIDTRPR